MIQASELRLNNWIRLGGMTSETRQTYTPRRITVSLLAAIQEENEERPNGTLSVFMPISLTPELLEKAGFGKTMSGNYSMMDEDCWLDESKEGGWDYSVCISANKPEWHPVATVKYLHQLQNLFYCLAGTELEVNL
jgi:hypothetical protein